MIKKEDMSNNIFNFINQEIDEPTFEDISFNNDIEEISNEVALESPLGNQSFFAKPPKSELWYGYVDFFKAIESFGVGSLKVLDTGEGILLEEVIVKGRIKKRKFNYKNLVDSNKGFQSHWEFNETAYSGRAIVNKKEDYLDDDKVFFSYEGLKGKPFYGSTFSIYKPYDGDSNTGSINRPNVSYLKKNAAIQIQGLGFGGFLILLQGMEGRVNEDYLNGAYKLVAKLIEKFSKSNTRPSDYLPMLASLNEKILQYISKETLLNLWLEFIKIENLTNFYEKILLNLLMGISNKPNFNADAFLTYLLTSKVDGETLFLRLYNKMNDWGGPNNFSGLIVRLTLIWMDSSFTNTNSQAFKNFDRPVNLAYKQKKILGFRFDDYNFDFNKKGHIEVEIEPGIKIPNNFIGSIFINEILEKQEIYHPFFPITLTELDETENEDIKLETEIPLPAFYLKAFDDKGVWENFEKSIWLAVDIITVATGVGNLLKLRHLLNLKTAYTYLKLAYGVMEVTSGIIAIALNFVDKCEDKEFCNKLRQYLFWFEICTLSADALTTRILRKQARQANDALKAFRKKAKSTKRQKQLDELETHLVNIAENEDELFRKIEDIFDSSGGKLLTKKELNLLKDFLWQKYKVRVRLIDVDHKLKNKLKDWDNRNVVGSFRKGPPPELFLRSNNASELTVFHEMVHLKYWNDKRPNIHFAQEEVIVFNEIWKTKNRWANKEILDSYNYVVRELNKNKLDIDLDKFINKYQAEIFEIKIKTNLGIK
ncbi:hypothetical protein [Winogradskyella luteola]|uniref:Tox-MPTase4 domain-containing protein n=1 Tax=Winogradskyella luteola TaxID=2828330 RepID=A0A9X1JPW2_9FLAO|nr:hypothetical protein [Winogradskyella luteola]MBV7269109.1 hypothetical protein [Winogradskyella luteola]